MHGTVLDSVDIGSLTVDETVDPTVEQNQQNAPAGLENQPSETVRNSTNSD